MGICQQSFQFFNKILCTLDTTIIFSKYKVPCSNHRALPLRIFIRKVWKKEDVGRGQHSPDHHLLLVLLLQLIPHVESHQCADNNDLLHCHDTRLLLAIRGKIYK